MLTVLGGLAEFERYLILSRTAEGRTRAKASGVKFGRKPTLTPHQRMEALARRAAGEVDIARSYAVSHSTISRLRPLILTPEPERRRLVLAITLAWAVGLTSPPTVTGF
jgi:DNA invertase Pin-like site-specific DNA recombinase